MIIKCQSFIMISRGDVQVIKRAEDLVISWCYATLVIRIIETPPCTVRTILSLAISLFKYAGESVRGSVPRLPTFFQKTMLMRL
jgi:hypothetical protein